MTLGSAYGNQPRRDFCEHAIRRAVSCLRTGNAYIGRAIDMSQRRSHCLLPILVGSVLIWILAVGMALRCLAVGSGAVNHKLSMKAGLPVWRDPTEAAARFSGANRGRWIDVVNRNVFHRRSQPYPFVRQDGLSVQTSGFGDLFEDYGSRSNEDQSWNTADEESPIWKLILGWRLWLGGLGVWSACLLAYRRERTWRSVVSAIALGFIGTLIFLSGVDCQGQSQDEYRRRPISTASRPFVARCPAPHRYRLHGKGH